jgi:hypothetical protein
MSLPSCGGRSGQALVESNQAFLEPRGHPASWQAVVPPAREIAVGVSPRGARRAAGGHLAIGGAKPERCLRQPANSTGRVTTFALTNFFSWRSHLETAPDAGFENVVGSWSEGMVAISPRFGPRRGRAAQALGQGVAPPGAKSQVGVPPGLANVVSRRLRSRGYCDSAKRLELDDQRPTD